MEKLGEGGEAEVFALDDERVLRRFRRDHPSIDARAALMAAVARGAGALDVAVPELLDDHVDAGGHRCFVERRLPGRSMTQALGEVSGRQREALLTSYLDTAASLRRIQLEAAGFGELIADPPLRCATWSDYLHAALERQVGAVPAGSYTDIDLPSVAREVHRALGSIPEPEPAVVHFDYFPGNVLCDDERITAVIDWSVLTIVGDPDLDLAMAVAYLGVTPTTTPEDRTFGLRWLAERGLRDRAHVYERWSALWWAPVVDDEQIPVWVRSTLSRPPPR